MYISQIRYLLLLPLSIYASQAFAQDQPTDEIEVFKPYQPILADAYKLCISPSLPVKEEISLQYQYSVPPQLKSVSYLPPDLKPVSYTDQKELEKIYKLGFLKMGFGNYMTPLIHAGINYKKDRLITGFYGSYSSSKNAKIEFQQYTDWNVKAFAKYNLQPEMIAIDAGITRKDCTFYGYDHELLSKDKKDVAIHYNTFSSKLQFTNSKKNKSQIDHTITVPFYHFTAEQASLKTPSETGIGTEIYLSKTFKAKHVLSLEGYFHHSTFKNNSTFAAGPMFTFYRPKGSLYLGCKLGSANEELQVLPYTYGEQFLISNKLIFFSGYKVDIVHNSIASMTSQNPWLSLPTTDSMTARFPLKNPITKYAQFGIKGNLFSHLDYKINAGQHTIINQLLFENDSLDLSRFKTIYTKNNIFDLEFDLKYNYNDQLHLGLNSHFYTYKPDSIMKAWHLPSFITELKWSYDLNKKIEFGNQIFLSSGAKAFDSSIVSLKTALDISVFFNYRFNDQFMFFVQGNNLANQKYSILYNYPVLGANFVAGVKYSF